MHYSVSFSSGKVQYLHSSFGEIDKLVPKDQAVIVTDSNIAGLYPKAFEGFKGVVILQPGEKHKTWQAIEEAAAQLLKIQAHRNTMLIGVGGGLVTDMTGFLASVYMRGMPFAFVPTSLLGMVDAAIGGKNGVNSGRQKNLLGVIRQPQFILYDTHFLDTLPDVEWSNGFAEIIKYACIFDEQLFATLSKHDIIYYRKHEKAMLELIESCVHFKNRIVLGDEHEANRRKLLNFGHTAGHAFETLYNLPHGYAISLGMILACMVSERVVDLQSPVKNKLAALLLRYRLPIMLEFSTPDVMEVLRMDKKRSDDHIDFVMLSHLGNPIVKPILFETIQNALFIFNNASHN